MTATAGAEYRIQINDSAGDAEPAPITMRLFPGEEEKLLLRVVNLGDPTNLNVRVGASLAGQVKPKKANHYIVLEEAVQLTVRIPEDADVLRGDIILRTDTGSIKVPVTLVCEVPDELLMRRSTSPDSGEPDEDDGKTEGGGLDEDISKDWVGDDGESSGEGAGSLEDDRDYDESYSRDPDDRYAMHYLESGRSKRSRRPLEDSRYPQEAGGRSEQYDSRGGNLLRDEPATLNDEALQDLIGPEEYFRGKSRRDPVRFAAVPAALIIALLAMLVLTFYTRSVPEFPGALASSMLIVTLIIYSAATMLRA